MNSWVLNFLFVIAAIITFSCGEVFEEDISGEEIYLLAPADSAQLSDVTVTMWWERLPGARAYEFRLVSPSFSNPVRVIADSITTLNRLTFMLAPGSYEWEVRGLNGGFSTSYYYRSFSVDSLGGTEDISNRHIELSAPADNLVSTSTKVSFLWEEINPVDNYELLIVTPNFDSIRTVYLDTMVSRNLINLQLDSGQYQWGVRAHYEQYKTKFSIRNLTVDPE